MREIDDVVLEPVLTSVARARSLVGRLAERHRFDPVVAGDAALVVSELVTNAVLHARTTVVLAVGVEGQRVRIEVTDGSDVPVARKAEREVAEQAAEAFDEPATADFDDVIDALGTTGRGMELVASLASRWGVTAHAGGKTVWAELGLEPTPVRPAQVAYAEDDHTEDHHTDEGAADASLPVPLHPRSAESGAGQTVRLVAVPVRLIVDSDRNFDDTIRELQVIALSEGADPEIGRLARSATALLTDLGAIRYGSQDEVRAARARGDRLVDLHLVVGEGTHRHLRTLDALLAAIAAARSTGRLLVMSPAPEVLAFRLWYRDETMRQLEGAPVQPCPFPAVRRSEGRTPAGAPLSDRRRRLLADLEKELAAAHDPRAVARIALERVQADTGAAFVNLLLVEPDGGHVSVIDRIGYSPEEQFGRRYRVSADNPISEAVRTAQPIVLRTREERLNRYPRMVPSRPLEHNPTAVWVPLGPRAPATGALVVGFGRARDFADRDLRFLLEVAEVIRARIHQVGRQPPA